MKILAIDTSNKALAVSVCEDNQVIGNYYANTKKNHSITLMPIIDLVMKENNLQPKDLDRIVVAEGPGSYTGLRIGVTTAKTLAWTLGIELVGVSSLACLAANVKNFSGYIIPLFDARRKNVYTGAFQWDSDELVNVIEEKHTHIDNWLEELATLKDPLLFVGEDVDLFEKEILTIFPAESICRYGATNAVNASSLAELSLNMDAEKNIQAFVPNYLKLVEAEEKWLKENKNQRESYVEKI